AGGEGDERRRRVGFDRGRDLGVGAEVDDGRDAGRVRVEARGAVVRRGGRRRVDLGAGRGAGLAREGRAGFAGEGDALGRALVRPLVQDLRDVDVHRGQNLGDLRDLGALRDATEAGRHRRTGGRWRAARDEVAERVLHALVLNL